MSISCSRRLYLLTLLGLCGCFGGGEKLPTVVPVSGVVTFDGQPVEGAYVVFNPNDKNVRTAGGRTNAQGEYKLSTFKEGDGCTPGRMTVTISKSDSPADPDPKTGKVPPAKNYLPIRYSELNNSGFEAKVEAKGENKFDFKLEK